VPIHKMSRRTATVEIGAIALLNLHFRTDSSLAHSLPKRHETESHDAVYTVHAETTGSHLRLAKVAMSGRAHRTINPRQR